MKFTINSTISLNYNRNSLINWVPTLKYELNVCIPGNSYHKEGHLIKKDQKMKDIQLTTIFIRLLVL